MSFAAALARLATWSVSGVTSYAIGAEGAAVQPADTPALVIDLGEGNRQSYQRTVTGGAATIVVFLDHLLLVKAVGLGRPVDRVNVAALVDLYIAAARADWLLNDTLIEPLRFNIGFGQIEWGGYYFYGVTFSHEWVLSL